MKIKNVNKTIRKKFIVGKKNPEYPRKNFLVSKYFWKENPKDGKARKKI